jgi:hypothetical protein
MTDIQERLQHLEKSNRRMRICGIGVAAIAAAVTTIAATSGDPGDRGGQPCDCAFVITSSLQNSGYSLLGGPVECYGNADIYGPVKMYSDLEVWGSARFLGGNGLFSIADLENTVNSHSNDILDNAARIDLLEEMVGACCEGSACSSDSNNDGMVNIHDLLALINAWGDCVAEG